MVLADIRDTDIGAERAVQRTLQPVAQCMSQDCLNMPDSTPAAEALDRVRESQLPNGAAGYIFVHGPDRRHIGFVRLSALLRADGNESLAALVEGRNKQVSYDTDREQASRELQRLDLPMLPILDEHGRLAGVLQFDTAMDILEEEASEDVYKKAGIGDLIHQKEIVRSEKLTSGGIGYSVKVRLSFLMVTLAGGIMVGGLIDFFEGTLEALVALAIFIPLVMDMGGNVGTQSTTIFARGLALGHIDLGQFFRKHVGRELLVGLTMGVVLATLGGLIAYFWQGAPNGMPLLGVVVGVALMFSVTTACLLGFLLPWLLLKLGVDHAPGADPFVTTIKDFTGLAVYFLTAVWLLDLTV
ncbi:MAG: magnesium transporter [Gammaproteobacteria bacterium]|nr:magnesium transporter [Gammaproteobacteria bacterium]